MKLIGQTEDCKICFKQINFISLFHIFNKVNLCEKCSENLKPIFEFFEVDEIKALSIFEYDEIFKNLIYQFKGCYDIELRTIFLGKYKREINMIFKGYIIIPAPSSEFENIKRGFNHVEEIFSILNLPLEKHFEKIGEFKQADHNFNERKNIKNYIKLSNENFDKKKYLLVDDIYTTGATMKTMISLLKDKGISNIKVLVLCKTKLKGDIYEN